MPALRNTRMYSRTRLPTNTPPSPTSSQTDPASSPPPSPRKRPSASASLINDSPPAKRRKSGGSFALKLSTRTPTTKHALSKPGKKQPTLTQLHLLPDQSVMRDCKLCGLSYTHAALEDERIHKAHCVRVRKGMEWGRDDERALGSGELAEVAKAVKLKNGKTGRVISFRGDISGKIGRKLATLLETVNLALSSPELPPSALKASKAYLFLLPSTVPSRESIVGVVMAQHITTAMAIASAQPSSPSNSKLVPVHIDPTTSLYLDPTPLPTSLGISRIFVSSTHRRQGIAHHLLDQAARTFLRGCDLDPAAGEVAFSQPTAMGRAVMESWGAGGVRVYEE